MGRRGHFTRPSNERETSVERLSSLSVSGDVRGGLGKLADTKLIIVSQTVTRNCVTVSLPPTDPTAIEKRMVNFLSPAELRPTLGEEPAAELSEEELFTLRDSHVLFFDDQAEGAWRTQFPYLASVREPGGDRGLALSLVSSRESCCRSCDCFLRTYSRLETALKRPRSL